MQVASEKERETVLAQTSASSANRRRQPSLGSPRGAHSLSRRLSKNTQPSRRAAAKHKLKSSVRDFPESKDWATIQELFLSSRPRFLGLAYSVLRNKEDAEDALQDALVSAFRNLQGFEGRSALTTWFTRIVLNAALMIRRKRRPGGIEAFAEAQSPDEIPLAERIPDTHPDPERAFAEKETFQWIDASLQEMSPLLREAFTMVYYGEMSSEEGGALLGVAAGTFKSRAFRARQELITEAKRSFAVPVRGARRRPSLSQKADFQSLGGMPVAAGSISAML